MKCGVWEYWPTAWQGKLGAYIFQVKVLAHRVARDTRDIYLTQTSSMAVECIFLLFLSASLSLSSLVAFGE